MNNPKLKIIPNTNFKKTEIGYIPEDWQVKRLGEIVIRFISGGTPTTEIKEYWNGNIPWIRSVHLKSIFLDYKNITKTITEEGLQNSSTNIVPKNNLIIATRVAIGKVSKNNIDVAISQDLTGLIIDRSNVVPLYLVYLFSNKKFQKKFEEFSRGTTIKGIALNSLKSLLIPLPPKEEQEAIAMVLSDFDRLIEELDKLIAKKKAIKQAAMQDLLSAKKRLPGFHQSWVKKKLGEVAEIKTGGTPPTREKKYWKGEYLWVTPSDIRESKVVTKTERKISFEGVSLVGLIPKNSLLVTCIASIGKNAIIRQPGACNQQINALIPYSDYDVDFLYYLIENNKKSLLDKAGKTATPIINKNDFSNLVLSFPINKDEQRAIAKILSDMDAEIEALEKKKHKYELLKQAAMDLLLTGKMRIKVENSSKKPKHSQAFNEAVLISVLVNLFATQKYPLSRYRYTKLSYIFHRLTDNKIEDYQKMDGGPYNPKTRYKGPENIALTKKYIKKEGKGFLPANNIKKAIAYFKKWYTPNKLETLISEFKFKSNEELEAITTIDFIIIELKKQNKSITVENIINYLNQTEKWREKLNKEEFTEEKIKQYIEFCLNFFRY